MTNPTANSLTLDFTYGGKPCRAFFHLDAQVPISGIYEGWGTNEQALILTGATPRQAANTLVQKYGFKKTFIISVLLVAATNKHPTVILTPEIHQEVLILPHQYDPSERIGVVERIDYDTSAEGARYFVTNMNQPYSGTISTYFRLDQLARPDGTPFIS